MKTFNATMPVPDVIRRMMLFDKIESILSAKTTHHKSKQQEPITLTEHEFFFDIGKHTKRYVCMGKDRIDAQMTALDAMRGSYFILREE